MTNLVERFFDEELTDHVSAVLDQEPRSRTSGSRYFTFNMFNVRLDFDRGIATIEDELVPADSESLGLDELRKRIDR